MPLPALVIAGLTVVPISLAISLAISLTVYSYRGFRARRFFDGPRHIPQG